jgi:hypothetical protein
MTTLPPRPDDPAIVYASFLRHVATCMICTQDARNICPYGEHLLECWGDSEMFYKREQAAIDAVFNADTPEHIRESEMPW